MSALVDLRPRLLSNQLVRCGVPEHEALALVSVLSALSTNATRYAAAREVLRGYAFGPSATRVLLQDFGLWERERCAREGCTRELGVKKAIVVIRARGYCGVACALEAIGAVPA